MNPNFRKLIPWLQAQWRRWRVLPFGRGIVVPPAQPPPAALPSPLRACATVVIPALNEAGHIADVVRHARADPATAEVIVIDDSSIDDTARLAREAGAEVVTSSMLGKGASMRDGVGVARSEFVVYLDGDLSGLRDQLVTDLCRPLMRGEADFVKARFGRRAGRVTALTAKPMLEVFFPELAHIAQPLGGLIAARASLLATLNFEEGYGVDIGLLIDAHRAGARVTEVDIGTLEHDSQPLEDLAAMANEVSRVIYSRARDAGRLHMEQIAAMYESQRQATATLDYILSRRRGRTRLVLLGMDGTITSQRYLVELARATGQQAALVKLLESGFDAAVRDARIAALFKFVHRRQFEKVAQALSIRPGVIACVNRLRRAGFMVGVVGEGYFVAAEILRRRIFADFALTHLMLFEGDVCKGDVRPNEAFESLQPTGDTRPCAGHAVQRFRLDDTNPRVETIWAVGCLPDDLEMLRQADKPFVLDAHASDRSNEAGFTHIASFDALAALVDESPRGEAEAAGA